MITCLRSLASRVYRCSLPSYQFWLLLFRVLGSQPQQESERQSPRPADVVLPSKNDNTNQTPQATLSFLVVVSVMIMAVMIMIVVIMSVVVIMVVVVVVVEVLLQAEGGRAAAVRVSAVAVSFPAGSVGVSPHGLHRSHSTEAEHYEQELHQPPAAVVALSLQHLRGEEEFPEAGVNPGGFGKGRVAC